MLRDGSEGWSAFARSLAALGMTIEKLMPRALAEAVGQMAKPLGEVSDIG